MNVVHLVGTLGMDPELKFTQGGHAVLRLRMATNETWMKDGERQQRTEWHTVIVWGPRAEGLNKALQKGSGVWVTGKLQTRSWENKDGQKQYSTEINASDIGFTGRSPSNSGGRGGQETYDRGQRDDSGSASFSGGEDDIPF